MSLHLTRQCFTPESLRQIVPSRVRMPVALKPYIDCASESTMFTALQMLAIGCQVIGERALLAFLKISPSETFRTMGYILEDHARFHELKPKDLQVNLIVNLVVRLTRLRGLHPAQEFKYAEDMLRQLELDSVVKVEMKEAMFDRHALGARHLHISYWTK